MKQRASSLNDGQFDVFGTVHGLERLVVKPEVVESDGLKVLHFAIKEEDKKVPGYLDEVVKQARKLEPEVRSRGKAPWLTAQYQTNKRKQKAGVL